MPEADQDIDRLASVQDTELFKKYIIDRRRAIDMTQFVWDLEAQHWAIEKVEHCDGELLRHPTHQQGTARHPVSLLVQTNSWCVLTLVYDILAVSLF